MGVRFVICKRACLMAPREMGVRGRRCRCHGSNGLRCKGPRVRRRIAGGRCGIGREQYYFSSRTIDLGIPGPFVRWARSRALRKRTAWNDKQCSTVPAWRAEDELGRDRPVHRSAASRDRRFRNGLLLILLQQLLYGTVQYCTVLMPLRAVDSVDSVP